jgi:uncharacterized protein with PIN domain
MKKSELKQLIREEIKKVKEAVPMAHPTKSNTIIDLIDDSEFDKITNNLYYELSDAGLLSNKCSKKYCNNVVDMLKDYGKYMVHKARLKLSDMN